MLIQGLNMATQKQIIDSSMVNDLPRCLANSAAILFEPQTHHSWVRPGIIFIWCISPGGVWQDIADFDLQPVMTFNSEVLAIQSVKKGEQIGYGSRYTAQRDMRIAVVACGYADGYPKACPVMVHPLSLKGHKTQLVGRISMDMLTIDVTDLPDVEHGSPVELWGKSITG